MPKSRHHFLRGARAYLSGPMDFVANREDEKLAGWRVRIGEYLRSLGVTVFDPWNKPLVRGLHEYGREDLKTIERRDRWTFDASEEGAVRRHELADYFWETLHVDLRMVDLCDFVIAYCPTNVYSVGTVHEIVLARQQRKPVLLVSPPVDFPALAQLEAVVSGNAALSKLLAEVKREVPIRSNPNGTPSLWYMSLIGTESFFDGFGFSATTFQRRFPTWKDVRTDLDKRESRLPPNRPLLQFLQQLASGRQVPRYWHHESQSYRDDDDWLLLEQALD